MSHAFLDSSTGQHTSAHPLHRSLLRHTVTPTAVIVSSATTYPPAVSGHAGWQYVDVPVCSPCEWSLKRMRMAAATAKKAPDRMRLQSMMRDAGCCSSSSSESLSRPTPWYPPRPLRAGRRFSRATSCASSFCRLSLTLPCSTAPHTMAKPSAMCCTVARYECCSCAKNTNPT